MFKKIEKEKKGKKRKKREKGLQSPPSTAHHPKTEVEVVVAAVVAVAAVSGTAVRWKVAPRTAPQSFICLILLFFALFSPRTTIIRCALIIFLEVILTPLPDIAVHIIQTKTIGGILV